MAKTRSETKTNRALPQPRPPATTLSPNSAAAASSSAPPPPRSVIPRGRSSIAKKPSQVKRDTKTTGIILVQRFSGEFSCGMRPGIGLIVPPPTCITGQAELDEVCQRIRRPVSYVGVKGPAGKRMGPDNELVRASARGIFKPGCGSTVLFAAFSEARHGRPVRIESVASSASSLVVRWSLGACPRGARPVVSGAVGFGAALLSGWENRPVVILLEQI